MGLENQETIPACFFWTLISKNYLLRTDEANSKRIYFLCQVKIIPLTITMKKQNVPFRLFPIKA